MMVSCSEAQAKHLHRYVQHDGLQTTTQDSQLWCKGNEVLCSMFISAVISHNIFKILLHCSILVDSNHIINEPQYPNFYSLSRTIIRVALRDIV